MIIDFTPDEVRFLVNTLIDRRQSPLLGHLEDGGLINVFISKVYAADFDFDNQMIGFLQSMMQEQSEVWGSRRSTANEKLPVVGPGLQFVPQRTLILVKSVSDKLGAHLTIDTQTRTDETPTRAEGSTWIMKNVLEKRLP